MNSSAVLAPPRAVTDEHIRPYRERGRVHVPVPLPEPAIEILGRIGESYRGRPSSVLCTGVPRHYNDTFELNPNDRFTGHDAAVTFAGR